MMKNHIRCGFSLFLSLLLIVLGAIGETKEEEIFTIGDYSYTYKEDGSIKIVEVFPDESRERVDGYTLDLDEGAMNYIPSSINGCPVSEIGENALSSLKILSWTIPGTVKKIGSGAFSFSDVETVIMEEGIEELGDRVFENMVVTHIEIPSTVNIMGDNPFCACHCLNGLPEIVISPENEHFYFQNGVLFDRDESKLIYYPWESEGKVYQIPDGVKAIGSHAFDGCSMLEAIIIPDSVIYIGEFAFNCCCFQSIQLPRNLQSLNDGTFYCMTELQTVFIPASVIKFGDDIFWKCNQAKLLVERGSMAELYALENGLNYKYVE